MRSDRTYLWAHNFPSVLNWAEPIRILSTFILTVLATQHIANRPIVIASLCFDLAFLTLVLVASWFPLFERSAHTVLGTYNWLTVVARGGQLASRWYLWNRGGEPKDYMEWVFMSCTIVDFIYSLIACACRVLWLALTGLSQPPLIISSDLMRHGAECTKKLDPEELEHLQCPREKKNASPKKTKSGAIYNGAVNQLSNSPTLETKVS